MENQEIIVSVELPVYNGGPYLKKCLDSICNQTYKNLDIIIHDNGSTDNSRNILEEYASVDKRIRLIKVDKQQAAGPARNEAVRLAKGEFIIFLDADDSIAPTYVEKLLGAVVGKDVAYCDWLKFYPSGKTEERRARRLDDKQNAFDRSSILALQKRIVGDTSPTNPLNLDLFSSICGKIYRVSLILDHDLTIIDVNTIGGADDALFNFDYMQFAQSGAYVDECLYYYFSNPNSFTHTHKIGKLKMFTLQYDQFKNRIKKYDKSSEYLRALDYRIFIQSFAAFIIAQSSHDNKKAKIEALSDYFNDPYVSEALTNVSARTFSLLFRPFFAAVIKKRIRFCLAYINLAIRYRNLR
jgi:glycosyltransferase involved in cell wall biosynthesis